MNRLKLTLRRAPNSAAGWRVGAEYLPDSQLAATYREGDLRLDRERVTNLAFLPPLAENVLAYGIALGEAVFHDDVGQLFDHALGQARAGLRVLLSIEDPELKRYRWERL